METAVTIDGSELSNSPGSSGIILGCLVALLGLLRASPVPNWIANWIVVALGIIGQGSVSGWSIMSAMQGVIVGASAVGTYKVAMETDYHGKDKFQTKTEVEKVAP